jgi:hypothetical protein
MQEWKPRTRRGGISNCFALLTLILVCVTSAVSQQNAQTPELPAGQAGPQFTSHGVPLPMPPEVPAHPGVGTTGVGTTLIITPTFDSSIDSATQTVINNAIAFYESTFSNNVTVNIYFYNMSSGLGSSYFVTYNVPFTSYRAALAGNASSTDDTTALANTPANSTNPVNNGANVGVKPATGRALGLNTPEVLHNFSGSPCPTFTGSGCIGINVTSANSFGGLTSVVEHEIDEILGLGSALSGTTTPDPPWSEDLSVGPVPASGVMPRTPHAAERRRPTSRSTAVSPTSISSITATMAMTTGTGFSIRRGKCKTQLPTAVRLRL